ncbi:acyltransferase family protein [Neotamlana laminarinivorans]|uniref:Acyltransferase n=1 Tax=Neotamlana laminarinivorans TaxID=2883124 RepID=A0A9X1L4G8_9FLAO|nr:acyltransferase [Tamlana laminarinivorans]MCB4798326.1 acyltransferase [Tamlana laminarinivorans]
MRARINYIDIVRGIAAMLVLFQHYMENSYDFFIHTGEEYINFGLFGVIVFFIISGFVIPFSVQKRFDLKTFVKKRILRIYPAYLFVFLLCLFLGFFIKIPYYRNLLQSDTSNTIIFNLLLIQEYVKIPSVLGVSWTLSLEFFWYFMFSLFFFKYGNNANKLIKGSSVFIILIALLSFLVEKRLPLGRFLLIHFAVIGYYCFENYLKKKQNFKRTILIQVLVFNFALFIGFYYFQHKTISYFCELLSWNLAYIFFFLFYFYFDYLRNKTMEYLGKISYSVYLLHTPVYLLYKYYFGKVSGLEIILVTAICIVFSALSYHYIEEPFVALGRRKIGLNKNKVV